MSGPGAGRTLRRLADAIDALSIRVGEAAAWLYPILVAVLIANVGLRYGLGRGFIELEELQWHLFAAAFLLGFAYTHAADEHVRVDLLRERTSERARAWVDLLGALFLLLPFAAVATWYGYDFFWRSWSVGERSAMPSGLPARYVIKGVLLAGMALLGVQALGSAARSAGRLLNPRDAEPPAGEAAGGE